MSGGQTAPGETSSTTYHHDNHDDYSSQVGSTHVTSRWCMGW